MFGGSVQWILVFWVAITCGQQYYYYGDEGPYASTNLNVPIQSSYNQTPSSSWARNDEDGEDDDEEDEDDDDDQEENYEENQMRRSGRTYVPFNFPIKPGTYYEEGENLKADPGYLDDKNNRQGRFLWPFSITVSKDKAKGIQTEFASEYPLHDSLYTGVDVWDTTPYNGWVPPDVLAKDKKKANKYDPYSEKKFQGLTKEDYWYLHSRGYRKYRRKKRKKIKKLKKKLKLKRVIQKIIEKKIERYEGWAPEEPWW